MAIAWYSDFNGVFNIPKSNPSVETVSITPKGSDFLRKRKFISWDPMVLGLFNEVIETGLFDFQWITTWNDAGNIHRATEVMGIGHLNSHIEADLNKDARNKREWTKWKADTIIENQRLNPQPYIWVDDDAPIFWEDYVKGNTLAPSLIIKTSSKTGLTKNDLLTILNWGVEHSQWNAK